MKGSTYSRCKYRDATEGPGSSARATPTVGEYVDRWLAADKKPHRSTRETYREHIENHLGQHLGLIELDRLRVSHLTEAVASLRSPLANKDRGAW